MEEEGTRDVQALLTQTEMVGTAMISKVEVSSALAKCVRMGTLTRNEAAQAYNTFCADWPRFNRFRITDILITQASSLAWEYGLRGYDAVHLSATLLWQEMLGEPIYMATYDRELWRASLHAGLKVFPSEFP